MTYIFHRYQSYEIAHDILIYSNMLVINGNKFSLLAVLYATAI